MSPVTGGAIVPGAALLLEEASPGQPHEAAPPVASVRHAVATALGRLPAAEAVLLIGPGPPGVHDRARADLRPLGVAAPPVEVPVARRLLPAVSRLAHLPRLQDDPLGVELTVLVRLLARHRPRLAVLAVSVPGTAAPGSLSATGAAIAEAVTETGTTATVVAASDLSAGLHDGSPRYLIDGARAWDDTTIEQLRRSDWDALAALDREEAARVEARGWAPLVVLAGLARAVGLATGDVSYHEPRGVGGVVARLVDAGRSRSRPDHAVRPRAGVLPATGDPPG